MRVLIVDDNEDTGRGLGSLLTIQGPDVETAPDGTSGIGSAHRHRARLILLDIGLPGMDGYEVARRLRAEGIGDATIIAVSGCGEEARRRGTR